MKKAYNLVMWALLLGCVLLAWLTLSGRVFVPKPEEAKMTAVEIAPDVYYFRIDDQARCRPEDVLEKTLRPFLDMHPDFRVKSISPQMSGNPSYGGYWVVVEKK